MTNQEFRNTWMREASNQPGLMLDVLSMGNVDILKGVKSATKAA